MSTLAVAAAALLVAALLALPSVVGSVTEARVRERVAAIDASPTATAEIKSFDRGWFRSTARIELRFVADNVAQLPNFAANLGPGAALPVAIDFAHGPIAVLDGVHFRVGIIPNGHARVNAAIRATLPGYHRLRLARAGHHERARRAAGKREGDEPRHVHSKALR